MHDAYNVKMIQFKNLEGRYRGLIQVPFQYMHGTEQNLDIQSTGLVSK
jgi:hypothetical protein